ncbi:PEP-CTERM sorting domain-containing protein [Planctomycetota bacterium]|nr:PEP-CTERM sorting domain-containing protein [Planctomycetota bacterium]
MNLFKSSISLLVTITLLSSTHAAGISFTRTVDTETNSQNSGSLTAYVRANVNNQTTNIITSNFANLPETPVSITLTAPTGYRFHAKYDNPGTISAYIINNALQITQDLYHSNTNTTFHNLQGIAPPPVNATYASLSGPGGGFYRFAAYFNIAAQSEFTFDAITLNATIPAHINLDLSSYTSQDIVSGIGGGQNNILAINDFQFVKLIPIPEPASLSLITLASSTLLIRKRK